MCSKRCTVACYQFDRIKRGAARPTLIQVNYDAWRAAIRQLRRPVVNSNRRFRPGTGSCWVGSASPISFDRSLPLLPSWSPYSSSSFVLPLLLSGCSAGTYTERGACIFLHACPSVALMWATALRLLCSGFHS